ncbi:MAG: guanylate kinase [Bifidobacteriaceae bacterium]|jgi:guanylate kinase|nr:guanylate kinase [Bifidobacteriaceae bacterium]
MDGPIPGRLTVLVGPSGVGKGTVAALLAGRYPQVFLSVSATTRTARPGESDGHNYRFVTPVAFEAAVARGEMLEWAVYDGQLYGTPRAPVEAALAAGRPALLEIDLVGARQVRAAMPDSLALFLLPPTWQELQRRLVERGTENPTRLAARLARAKEEIAASDEFDAVVVNGELDRTVEQVASLMGLTPSAHQRADLPASSEGC